MMSHVEHPATDTAPVDQLLPVRTSERIASLDVLRGVSLQGILLLNITAFGLVFEAYDDPTVQGGAEGLDLVVWIINNMFFEGTMRAMFSMLFGVGMVLMTMRMEKRGGGIEIADIYYRRTILLILFGMFHAYFLLWVGDILYAYGLFGLLLFPLRKFKPNQLIIGAALLTLMGVTFEYCQYKKNIKNFHLYEQAKTYSSPSDVPPEIQQGSEAWETFVGKKKPEPEEIQRNVDKMHGSYISMVLALASDNRMMQTVYNYTYNPFDVLPMMLLGIALYRLRVVTAKLRIRAYLTMAAIGYAIGLSINYYETMLLINSNFAVQALAQAGVTYHLGRIALAFGHIGAVMIFCKLPIMNLLKRSLAAVGKMTLTNYVMDSVICGILFTGVGFSLYGQLQRHELFYIAICIWIFKMIASPLWLKFFLFGPLEWLWRSLTYMNIQPIKKEVNQR
jgi:uncharacterized protein